MYMAHICQLERNLWSQLSLLLHGLHGTNTGSHSWHQVTLSSKLSHHPSEVYFYKIESGSEKIGMLGLSVEISF